MMLTVHPPHHVHHAWASTRAVRCGRVNLWVGLVKLYAAPQHKNNRVAAFNPVMGPAFAPTLV
jgi:hypothetical protein